MSLGAGGLFEAVREQNPEHQPSARLRKLCSTRGFEASSPWFLMPPPLIHAAANCAKARQAENEGHCGDGEVPGSPSNHVIAVCSLALTRGRGVRQPPLQPTARRREEDYEGKQQLRKQIGSRPPALSTSLLGQVSGTAALTREVARRRAALTGKL